MQIFKQNRDHLAKTISDGVIIMHGGVIQYRNADTWYPFRQDSNFHYLTGWPEPDAHAVITIENGNHQMFLFVLDKNEEMETWDGKRIGIKGAEEEFGATRAYPAQQFKDTVVEIIGDKFENIYIDYSSPLFTELDQEYLRKISRYPQRGAEFSNANLHSLLPVISEMRLIKKEEEISLLTKACEITSKGHMKAMSLAKPGLYEYQVAAELEKVFFDLGSERLGYPSIVAGGDNACTLHYSTNRDLLEEESLLLIDAGAEYNMYSADVTRTFPVSGKFSPPQAAVYKEVLKAQELGISLVKEESTVKEIHTKTIESISKSLIDLKLVPMGIEDTIGMMHYFEFFMHGTGHWLGLDVHDAGSVEENGVSRKLKKGMVTTIEPGIYVRPYKPVVEFPLLERDPTLIKERRDKIGIEEASKIEEREIKEAKKISHKIPEELLGIGVRIEDDILCTDDTPVNLTESAVKEIQDIEELCNS